MLVKPYVGKYVSFGVIYNDNRIFRFMIDLN